MPNRFVSIRLIHQCVSVRFASACRYVSSMCLPCVSDTSCSFSDTFASVHRVAELLPLRRDRPGNTRSSHWLHRLSYNIRMCAQLSDPYTISSCAPSVMSLSFGSLVHIRDGQRVQDSYCFLILRTAAYDNSVAITVHFLFPTHSYSSNSY